MNTSIVYSFASNGLMMVVFIILGLDEQLQWPDENCRQELASTFPSIFLGCIGVGDVKEFEIQKPLDQAKERMSYGGKKKINSYKMLSVIDHTGFYIFARVSLGKNDWEVY